MDERDKWLDELKTKIAHMNQQEKSEMLDVIRRKEEAIMQQVQRIAPLMGEALTSAYRDAWVRVAEREKQFLEELQRVKDALLEKKSN